MWGYRISIKLIVYCKFSFGTTKSRLIIYEWLDDNCIGAGVMKVDLWVLQLKTPFPRIRNVDMIFIENTSEKWLKSQNEKKNQTPQLKEIRARH